MEIKTAIVEMVRVEKRDFDIRHAPFVTVCHEESVFYNVSCGSGCDQTSREKPFVRRRPPIRRHLTRLLYSDNKQLTAFFIYYGKPVICQVFYLGSLLLGHFCRFNHVFT